MTHLVAPENLKYKNTRCDMRSISLGEVEFEYARVPNRSMIVVREIAGVPVYLEGVYVRLGDDRVMAKRVASELVAMWLTNDFENEEQDEQEES